MLRNEPPFQALRLRRLSLNAPVNAMAFCSDLRCRASLEELIVYNSALDTARAMGALVNAFIPLQLRKFNLFFCRVVPAALPELTRLIAAGTSRDLYVLNHGVDMFDEADESTQLFVTAVRASAMTWLSLNAFGYAPQSVVEAAAFVNARQQL